MPYTPFGSGMVDQAVKLQGWYAASGGRVTARANAAVIGNSLSAGVGASVFSRIYCQQLPLLLDALNPTPGLATHGRGFLVPVPFDVGWAPPYIASYAPSAPSATFGFGPGLFTYDLSQNGGTTVTYQLVADSADVMWIRGGGVLGYSVDGAAVVDIDTSGDFADGQITHVNLGAAGPHTLAVSYVGGGAAFFDGVVEYNGDYQQGIQVHTAGFSGSTASFWLPAGGSQSQPAAMAALNPGLIMIELGANDAAAGGGAAAYGANLTSLIAYQRAAYVTPPPFLLVAAYNAFFDGDVPLALWQQYVAAAYAVAAADPQVAIFDLSRLMPPTNAANTWDLYAPDGIHPNDRGHMRIADGLARFLSPSYVLAS